MIEKIGVKSIFPCPDIQHSLNEYFGRCDSRKIRQYTTFDYLFIWNYSEELMTSVDNETFTVHYKKDNYTFKKNNELFIEIPFEIEDFYKKCEQEMKLNAGEFARQG